MKRVLRAGVLWCVINMFFTGCSSMMVESDWDPKKVMDSVAQEETTSSNGVQIRYSDEERKKKMGDFYEENLSQKLEGLEGERAFMIADGHSERPEDLEDFQIERLADDGTFYYCYTTRAEGTGENRQKVHCASSYNYRSRDFHIIHETRFDSESWQEDKESFHMQVTPAEEGWQVFVYDNGIGSVYDTEGNLVFRTDIESFVRSCYSQAHSVMVTNAVTDGSRRIYLELVVEKEAINMPESPDADTMPIDEEQSEKEAEEAEAELEDKVKSQVMAYDFIPLDTTFDQYNDNFAMQKEAWINKVQGRTFSSDPDEEKDWQDVVEAVPDKWGTAVMPGYGRQSVLVWKDGIRFLTGEDGITSQFKPAEDSYEGFYKVEPDRELSDVFIIDNDIWYGVTGTVGGESDQTLYNPEVISRTYTYEYTVTTTDSEGNPSTETFTEERTQSLEVKTWRKTKMKSVQLEGHWVLDEIHTLGGCVNGRILAASDTEVFWLNQDRSLEKAGKLKEEGMSVGILEDGEDLYLVQYDGSRMAAAKGENWDKASVRWEIPYEKLTSRYGEGDTFFDSAFGDLNQEYLKDVNVYNNGARYTEKTVLKTEFDFEGKRDGFLLTSMNKGLVYYEPSSQMAALVAEGSWYGSWKQGEGFVSVGFSRGDRSYESMDVVFARVYEYDLEKLFKEAKEEREKQEQERKDALEKLDQPKKPTEESEPSGEGLLEETEVKPMEDTWREEYKDKWQNVDHGEAVRQGETFDAEKHSQEEKKKQDEEESFQNARIQEILGGMYSQTEDTLPAGESGSE